MFLHFAKETKIEKNGIETSKIISIKSQSISSLALGLNASDKLH